MAARLSQLKQVVENCQVEWDVVRGVLYVHNKDTGATVIRIGGLNREKHAPLATGQLDIALGIASAADVPAGVEADVSRGYVTYPESTGGR